jgi:sterol desaturase/sphingolipid hydroxylase (fatty acid hydroxylase superfamily)
MASSAAITLLVQAAMLGAGTALAAAWPRDRGQALLGRASWINLATGAGLGLVRAGLGILGVTALDLGWVDLRGLHPSAQLVLAFLALDLVRYLVHWADHRVPILWTFHRVHHSTEALDATAGLRMHLVDFLQLSAIPVLVFGVVLRVGPGWIVPLALSIGIVADGLEHANLRFTLDKPWRRAWFRLFNNPLFHSWHHTREGHRCDGNYANALPMWDRLFGTEVTPAGMQVDPPEGFGLADDQALEESVLGLQLLRPRLPRDRPAA